MSRQIKRVKAGDNTRCHIILFVSAAKIQPGGGWGKDKKKSDGCEPPDPLLRIIIDGNAISCPDELWQIDVKAVEGEASALLERDELICVPCAANPGDDVSILLESGIEIIVTEESDRIRILLF